MSGVAEDLYRQISFGRTLRIIHRGSVHIREQKRILADEERIGGGRVEQPSDWIIAREEREYELCDLIHVLSPFAIETFQQAGVPSDKLFTLLLGANVSAFKPAPKVIEDRCGRLAAGEPLRIICTGNFSRQKGARCWLEMFKEPGLLGKFRFVGTITKDGAKIARSLAQRAEFRAKVPQSKLPNEYAWADMFVLPTLQDGFAVVVAQALASGLPVITTTSCGASALVENGLTGWVIPPNRPDVLAERIQWADLHRDELKAAVHRLSDRELSRDWSEVARQFLENAKFQSNALGLSISALKD
jgi:glycosyltransferase involved in cell wall biosynthesis